MTLRELLDSAPISRREIRHMAAKVLNRSESELFLRENVPLSPSNEMRLLKWIRERQEGVPLAYLLGEAYFYGRPFYVDRSVLIPRPETEILIEKALEKDAFRVLDLCSGSGVIAITMALLRKIEVDATDLSKEALRVARSNAERHGVRVNFWESDLLEQVEGSYDLILSNPPYIDHTVLEELDVARYEPLLALDGGKEGLEIYRRLMPQSREHLSPGGRLILEIGYDQAAALTQMAKDVGFQEIEITRDLAGFDRVLTAVKPVERKSYAR